MLFLPFNLTKMFEKCQVVRGWEVCSVVSILAVVHKHNLASHYSDDNSFFLHCLAATLFIGLGLTHLHLCSISIKT